VQDAHLFFLFLASLLPVLFPGAMVVGTVALGFATSVEGVDNLCCILFQKYELLVIKEC